MEFKKKVMTSYLDKEKNDDLSWDYVWFQAVSEMQKSYMTGNISLFRKSVDNLEICLWGKRDEVYKKEITVLQHRYNTIVSEQQQFNFYHEKSQHLIALLDRATKGETKVSERAEDSEIIKEIAYKMINGIGQNLAITGAPGSGKSWSCGSLAEKVTSITKMPFDPRRHVTFTPKDFLRAYNDIEVCPPGSALIFEEVTVSGKMNSKETMSRVSRILNDVGQTSRYKRLFTLFNFPDLGELTKSQRKLLHWWLMTDKIDKNRDVCIVRPHVVAVNQRDGDIYYQNPRFDRTIAVTELLVTKPSQNFIDIYEPMQKAYKDELGRRSEEKIDELDEERELTQEENTYVECRLAGGTRKECANALKRGMNWGKRVDIFAKSKGYVIPDARGRRKIAD